ncbi:hypothetical protein TorRG33x02_115170 [Trema orientale]|uniref:DC1 domain-containing protein n=1 Tax=Trema orientale TaxID=63057 RepID=A0A2P5F4D9_TREOI|nr:hypothetical protein TorRG33x02_115170 [Trema orientale]
MLVVDDARDRGGTDECCFACHSPCILGVAYFSCTECKYFIHKSCAELPLKIRHALHIDHPLVLASRHTELITNSVNSGNLPIFHHCSTCQGKINPNGFFFLCCDHSCKRVRICVKCIFENPVINYEGHGQHRLCYVKKVPQILECNAYEGYCKLPATSVEICSTEYSMFRCVHCDFNLHLLCGPLPCTIKYKYHVHPLMLVDSVVENNSDEHYCDVCESQRDSRICVYYCQECKFVAHVYCLISEIIKALRGGNVELRTVEINDHRRKRVSSSTLKFCTIVNDLPKDEKGVFQTHFEMADFDRHSSTKLTRFTRDDFHRLIDWLNGYYCLKKQELEYPKSRMEFVTAEGYTIPKNLARILVLVLRKYGDISRQSDSTPEIKSIAFSFLCEVLNSMSTTKVTYITQYDLKEWYFYVNFARRRGFSVEFISEKLKDVVRAFLGLQAAAERSSEPDRFKRDLTRDILELQKELDDLKSESYSSFINWGEFTMECLDVSLKLIEEDHVAGNLLQL